MLSFSRFRDINQAADQLSWTVLQFGESVSARGMGFQEVRDVSWTVTDPSRLVVTAPARKANPFQLLYETLWVLGGRNNIDVLSKYIPRAKDFSDDGRTWRGAYGPRLYPQLHQIAELLSKDRYSRRAYLGLYDPKEDSGHLLTTRDLPCNTGLQFVVRPHSMGEREDGDCMLSVDTLDLSRFCRSNDLIYGYLGINHFEFSVILQMMANTLDLAPGTLVNHVTSLHAYDETMPMVAKLRGSEDPLYLEGLGPVNDRVKVDLTLDSLQEVRTVLLHVDECWDAAPSELGQRILEDAGKPLVSRFLSLARLLLYAHCALRRGWTPLSVALAREAVAAFGLTDLTVTALRVFMRNPDFQKAVDSVAVAGTDWSAVLAACAPEQVELREEEA